LAESADAGQPGQQAGEHPPLPEADPL
jgi:hypothetical protein